MKEFVEWRIGQGWSPSEYRSRLDRLSALGRNFDAPPEELHRLPGWRHYSSEAVIASESAGPPLRDGPFARARVAITNYEFSDPRIVTAHFDPATDLEGRGMLLELKVLGIRYLCGVVVGRVRDEQTPSEHRFEFRYETLEGHIESGAEWFLLTKDTSTGDIRFRVHAYWRPGEFPNWWSRIGFHLIGSWYQEKWHRKAHHRLALLARHGALARPATDHQGLAHQGPTVIFSRSPAADQRRR